MSFFPAPLTAALARVASGLRPPAAAVQAVVAWAAAKRSRFGWRTVMSAGFLVAFVASFALAGFSYVFCLSMGHAQTVCCCHAASAQSGAQASQEEQGPTFSRAPCCEARHFEAAQASSSVPRDPAPAIAAPVAILLSDIVPVVSVRAPRAVFGAPALRPLPQGRAPPPTAVHLATVRLLC